ncbi:hypothetical protein EK599_04960 [Vibrio sp. T187]|uniref:hypothetical protein n=1 Tax=Vibrio TaxID=662 RepID=UPI0010C9AE11|nr:MULTISPECIES: hypothetical protein [Vibrio]MBW3695029.1 hypothetical protein [Vibrio sp. T187]
MNPFLALIGKDTIQPDDPLFWFLLPHDLFFLTLSYGAWVLLSLKMGWLKRLDITSATLIQIPSALGVLFVLGLPTNFASVYGTVTSLVTVYACSAIYLLMWMRNRYITKRCSK